MGTHPPDHSTRIDVPRHDLPLLRIIPRSKPGTETISVPSGQIPNPEEGGRKFARGGMILLFRAMIGPVF